MRTGVYPCGSRKRCSWSFASLPAWGKPYIPCWTSRTVHKAVLNERLQIVMLHDIVGQHGDGHPHVFVGFHGSTKIEVFEIAGHETTARCRDDDVEEELGVALTPVVAITALAEFRILGKATSVGIESVAMERLLSCGGFGFEHKCSKRSICIGVGSHVAAGTT